MNLQFAPLSCEKKREYFAPGLQWTVKSSFSETDLSGLLGSDTNFQNHFQHGPLKQPQTRETYLMGAGQPQLDSLLTEVNQALPQILDLFYQPWCRSLFEKRWPISRAQFEQKVKMFTVINRDLPGFSMSPHIDNRFVVASMIVNLQENEQSTCLFDVVDQNCWFRASLARQEGLLILNTEDSLHGIETITKTRYTLYSNILLDFPV